MLSKSRYVRNVFKQRSIGTALLPSDKPARRLEDIIENAQAIQLYVAGMDVTAFGKDQRTYDAVERCLERISEAAAKLGDLAPSLMPGLPWREIRAIGTACVTSTMPYVKIGSGTSCKSISRRCAPPVRRPCGGCAKGKQANRESSVVTRKSCCADTSAPTAPPESLRPAPAACPPPAARQCVPSIPASPESFPQ
jgi:uncharacterized protein with HEPN domain